MWIRLEPRAQRVADQCLIFTEEDAEVALALSAMPESPRTIRRRLGRDWSLERLVAQHTIEDVAAVRVVEATVRHADGDLRR